MTGPLPQVAIGLACAWGVGCLIGLERSYNGRAAGFRTHALVALAAAASMVLTYEPAFLPALFPGAGPRLDPTRVAQGVLAGVGFLGAGVIFKEGVSVQGLTTAACIWATSAAGMLFGLGLLEPGFLFSAAILVTLMVLRWLEDVIPRKVYALASFRFEAAGAPDEKGLCALLGEHDIFLFDVSYVLRDEGKTLEYRANLKTSRPNGLSELSERLRRISGVVEFSLARISR